MRPRMGEAGDLYSCEVTFVSRAVRLCYDERGASSRVAGA